MFGPNGPMSSPIHNNSNSPMGPGGPMGGPNGNASMGPGMGSPNQMGIAGPKSSPMGNDPMGIPTPPGSMGPSTTPTSMPPCSTAPPGPNFKNSPIMAGGPNMNDPDYAQQFHDFQQQLYATNTRSSQMRGGGPPGPGGPPGGGMPPMGQGNFYAGPGSGPMSSSAK